MRFYPPQYEIRNTITSSVHVVLGSELDLYIDSQEMIYSIKILRVGESRTIRHLVITREV